MPTHLLKIISSPSTPPPRIQQQIRPRDGGIQALYARVDVDAHARRPQGAERAEQVVREAGLGGNDDDDDAFKY